MVSVFGRSGPCPCQRMLPVLQHAIDQSGEAVGHRRNGFGGAEPGAQSTVLGSEIAGAAEQRGRCHAQGRRSTVDHTPRASAQDSVATDPVVPAKSWPRGKVGLGFPPAHVQSYFSQNALRDHYFDPVDAGQVYSRDALEFVPEIKRRSILRRLFSPLLDFSFRRWALQWIAVIGKSGQVLIYLLVALGDPLPIGLMQVHFLLQHKHQFGTPIALQTFGNLFPASLDANISEFGQLVRIALPRYDRPHDLLSRDATQIANHVGQLQVHLGQCFLHP